MEFLAPMLVLITGALTIGSIWRAAIVNRRQRENARAWVDLQSKLIDKFGAAEEMLRYLESDAGRRLLDGQATAVASPHARVLDSIHMGLLVLMGGVGLLAASGTTDPQVHEVMRVLGMVATVLGVGFLASAGVSWALLRSWGQIRRDGHEGNTESAI
jgi:hypothetical protein